MLTNMNSYYCVLFILLGAFGYFECTHDITKYTKAAPFSEVGKKTKIGVRFSQVIGESGSADTVRYVDEKFLYKYDLESLRKKIN